MLKSFLTVAADVVAIADATVSVPMNLTRLATKPLAEAAQAVKSETDEIISEIWEGLF